MFEPYLIDEPHLIAIGPSAKKYGAILSELVGFTPRPSEHRSSLERIEFRWANARLRVVATDGRVLGIVDLPSEHELNEVMVEPLVFDAASIGKLAAALRKGRADHCVLSLTPREDGSVELISEFNNVAVRNMGNNRFARWRDLVPEVMPPSDFEKAELSPMGLAQAGALGSITGASLVVTSMTRTGPTRIDGRPKPNDRRGFAWQQVRFVVLTQPETLDHIPTSAIHFF